MRFLMFDCCRVSTMVDVRKHTRYTYYVQVVSTTEKKLGTGV